MIPALDGASIKLHLIGTGEESSWSPDGAKNATSGRRKRAVAPMACPELAQLVAELVNILNAGVDSANTWPLSTITRMCQFIEDTEIKKEDCPDADQTALSDAAKDYQVLLNNFELL